MQAEVKALKELVLTSTPSTPNKHLYPHLNQKSGSGHNRQSSLNQQQLNSFPNQIVSQNSQNSSNGSTYASTNLNQNNTINLVSSLSSNNSNTQVQPQSTKSTHKRVPSYSDLQTHSKNIIDKLFQANQNSNLSLLNTKSDSTNNSNNNVYSASITIEIAEVSFFI